MKRGVIIGLGAYLPQKIVTNADFEKILDTSDEWITSRTGIKQRHFAETETTSEMAAIAAEQAIADAGIKASDIDCIILGTATPDLSFPSTAVLVQEKLGIRDKPAFDLSAACSGFIYGLHVAHAFIKASTYRNILVIGAERISKLLNMQDRSTCVLFGDGAGAAVVQAHDCLQRQISAQGILASHIYADGAYAAKLCTTGGPGTTGSMGQIVMDGKEVFKHAVTNMGDAIIKILQEAGVDLADVNHFIPHQANARIFQTISEKFSIPMDKIILTIDQHANTSAASIPLAWHQAVQSGRVQKGDLILLVSFGAGFTWGAVLLRY